MTRRLVSSLLLLLLSGAPVLAQGNSQGKGRGAKAPVPSQSSVTPAAAIPGTGVRNFGVWLDDASFLPQGKGWGTFGIGYWRSMYGHQWDVPSMDVGWTLRPRFQVGASTPISRAVYNDGTVNRGIGDTYLSAKIGLINPEANESRFGVALAPVVEILSSGSILEGDSRFHWAIPVTLEKRFTSFRVYGAGGYFSRGSAFGAGAAEIPLTDRIVVTGVMSYSTSLEDDELADALELSKSRYDLSGAAMYVLTPTITLFGSVGRTISKADANASTIALSGGVSFGFNTIQTKHRAKNSPNP